MSPFCTLIQHTVPVFSHLFAQDNRPPVIMHQWEKETQMPWQIIVKCRLLAFLLPLYGQSIYDPKDTGVSTNFLAYKYLCSCQNAQGRSFDGTEVALLHRGGTRLLEEEASSLQDGHMKLEQITHSGHLRASKLPCPPHFFLWSSSQSQITTTTK